MSNLAPEGFRAGAILADPPWTFETYSDKGKGRSAERHYGTMTLNDIKAMGPAVCSVAAKDCALFLWATAPMLRGSLAVLEAWRFTFKTIAFVWVKTTTSGRPSTGMGFWTRSNAELCLLATRGHPRRLATDVHQIVLARRGAHSQKPAEVHERIEQLVAGPYLELFARRPVDGWQVWGDEVS